MPGMTITSPTYTYDGDGHRVTKLSGGLTTIYVYDVQGELAAEYAVGGAAPALPCTTCYVMADHLGSTRMLTDGGGTQKALYDYAPFGEELKTQNGRDDRWGGAGYGLHFTAKEQEDTEGDYMHYFEARYMSAAQGRFTSPDPLVWQIWNQGSAEQRGAFREFIGDPQNFNMYAYARNNPLLYTDPMGLIYQVCDTNGNCSQDKLSDEDFEKEKKRAKAAGEYFKGGKFYHYDSNGQKVIDGTYRQPDVDLNANAQSFFSDNKELWRNTAGAVNTAAVATAVVVAAPILADAALSLPGMQVAVGAGDSAASPIHVAYGTNGQWLHATGNQFFNMVVRARGAAGFARGALKFTVPVLYPAAVAATENCPAASCVTAAAHAFLRGWGLPF